MKLICLYIYIYIYIYIYTANTNRLFNYGDIFAIINFCTTFIYYFFYKNYCLFTVRPLLTLFWHVSSAGDITQFIPSQFIMQWLYNKFTCLIVVHSKLNEILMDFTLNE